METSNSTGCKKVLVELTLISGHNLEMYDICRIFAPRNIWSMKKELDAFSPAFMVELLDCPKKNAFPSRKGKPEMFRFNGGYYSCDEEGKMDGCHFYVQDYQGNNRMVVNAYTDEVEQISHYYPYGALMGDISTQPEKQDFKYSGKVLAAKRKIDNLSARRRALARVDRTYGLDLYDFHARQYDPLLCSFNGIESIESDIPGINWGFSSTPKPWTKEEQQKAVELHQQKIEDKINRQEALQKALWK